MNERPTFVRYRVLTWLTLAAALAYLCRNAVGVAESTIREDLDLTLTQSGWFMGAFFWTYAIFQVPGGLLAHRRGTRVAMTAFVLMGALATLALGAAPGFWLLIVAQLIMGITQAGLFPASCLSISHWIPIARRSFACGVLTTGMQVGAIISGASTGPLIEAIGWRLVFVLFAIPGIIWTIWFFLRFHDNPRKDPAVNPSELAIIESERDESDPTPIESESQVPTPWLAMLRNPAIWFLCGQQICRASGYMFFASWFPTFLQETRDVSVKDSGYLQSLVFAGTLAGCLFGGLLTDWIWKRTKSLRLSRSGVGAVFLGACGLLILAAWFVQNVSLSVTLLALGSFFAALAGPCAFSASIDIGGQRTPQVFGVMNMTGNFAAAATPILVGALFERTDNWNLVLLLFAAIYLAGAVCWALVDPSRHLRRRDSGESDSRPMNLNR